MIEVTWSRVVARNGSLTAQRALTLGRMQNPPTPECVRGAFYGLAAVCIWAAFIVVSRLGVSTSLTPWDVAAIRFSVAGSLLLPYVMSQGLALERLGWT